MATKNDHITLGAAGAVMLKLLHLILPLFHHTADNKSNIGMRNLHFMKGIAALKDMLDSNTNLSVKIPFGVSKAKKK